MTIIQATTIRGQHGQYNTSIIVCVSVMYLKSHYKNICLCYNYVFKYFVSFYFPHLHNFQLDIIHNYTHMPITFAGMSIFWNEMETTWRLIGTVSDGHLKMIWACAMARMAALIDSESVSYLAFQLLS